MTGRAGMLIRGLPALIIAVLIGVSPPSFAGETTRPSPEALKISSFADHLFREKDYYRAITEYKRLIFHFPDSPLAREAMMKIGEAYLEGGKYNAALAAFEKFRKLHTADPLSWRALFLMGEANLRMGDYSGAYIRFSEAEESALSPEKKREAALKRGWSLVKMKKWSEASQVFAAAGDGREFDALARELAEGERLPRKSPAVAGTLSALLPGAGQLYVGRKKDAAVSLLLNGVFILGAVEAFRKDEETVGAILLMFEAGWYSGNIYSAVNGAHKYNRKVDEEFIKKLEKRYYLGFDKRRSGLYGVFRLKF